MSLLYKFLVYPLHLYFMIVYNMFKDYDSKMLGVSIILFNPCIWFLCVVFGFQTYITEHMNNLKAHLNKSRETLLTAVSYIWIICVQI